MTRRSLPLLALALTLSAGAVRCGDVDVAKTIVVTDVFSGYYDDGVVADGVYAGQNRLLPSIMFKLKNVGEDPLAGLQLTVSFWPDGADGEKDSREVRGIGSTALAPGATTDEITVRAGVGYTSEAARADFFALSAFKDWTARLFAKRSGRIVPIGVYTIDRRLLPHQRDSKTP